MPEARMPYNHPVMNGNRFSLTVIDRQPVMLCVSLAQQRSRR